MICENCGNSIPDDGTFCANCGTQNKNIATASETNTPAEEVSTAQQPQKSKINVVTIIICILLSAVISVATTLIMVPILVGEDKEEKPESTTTVEAEETTEYEDITTEEYNEISIPSTSKPTYVSKELVGGTQSETGEKTTPANVEIKSVRLTQTKAGDQVIIVTYVLTNPSTSDDEVCFNYTFSDYVYQNGVELDSCYYIGGMIEGDPYNDYYDLDSSYIKPGYSAEIQEAYYPINTTSDIVVELEDYSMFTGDYIISRTFKFN